MKTRLSALVLALTLLVGGTMSASAAEKPDPYTFNTYTVAYFNAAQTDWLVDLYCYYRGYSAGDFVVTGPAYYWFVPIAVTCSGLR